MHACGSTGAGDVAGAGDTSARGGASGSAADPAAASASSLAFLAAFAAFLAALRAALSSPSTFVFLAGGSSTSGASLFCFFSFFFFFSFLGDGSAFPGAHMSAVPHYNTSALSQVSQIGGQSHDSRRQRKHWGWYWGCCWYLRTQLQLRQQPPWQPSLPLCGLPFLPLSWPLGCVLCVAQAEEPSTAVRGTGNGTVRSSAAACCGGPEADLGTPHRTVRCTNAASQQNCTLYERRATFLRPVRATVHRGAKPK